MEVSGEDVLLTHANWPILSMQIIVQGSHERGTAMLVGWNGIGAELDLDWWHVRLHPNKQFGQYFGEYRLSPPIHALARYLCLRHQKDI